MSIDKESYERARREAREWLIASQGVAPGAAQQATPPPTASPAGVEAWPEYPYEDTIGMAILLTGLSLFWFACGAVFGDPVLHWILG